MYHTIEFAVEFEADIEISPRDRLERVLVRRGTRVAVQIKPYVVETADDLIEVADLFFADGTTARAISFAAFSFID